MLNILCTKDEHSVFQCKTSDRKIHLIFVNELCAKVRLSTSVCDVILHAVTFKKIFELHKLMVRFPQLMIA